MLNLNKYRREIENVFLTAQDSRLVADETCDKHPEQRAVAFHDVVDEGDHFPVCLDCALELNTFLAEW